MRFWEQEGLTFDDVLLVPQYTDIVSRRDVSTRTRVTRNIFMDAPIIASNMDTITEYEMMIAMSEAGGAAFLHRFLSDDEIIDNLQKAREGGASIRIVSVGVSNDYKTLLDRISQTDKDLIHGVCIDIAHGACGRVVEAIKWIKFNHPRLEVIAGNVATGETMRILCMAGADAVKVGIGNGSMCITRKVAGSGVPLLSSLMDCYRVAEEFDCPIICDGGIKNSGDLVKAMAAGASSVITGSLVCGTEETPGGVVTQTDGTRMKRYRGMASSDAMSSWRGGSYKDVAAEGEATFVPIKGSVKDIVSNLCAGLRSGMTYSDATILEELRLNAIFVKNTTIGFGENGAHLLNRL